MSCLPTPTLGCKFTHPVEPPTSYTSRKYLHRRQKVTSHILFQKSTRIRAPCKLLFPVPHLRKRPLTGLGPYVRPPIRRGSQTRSKDQYPHSSRHSPHTKGTRRKCHTGARGTVAVNHPFPQLHVTAVPPDDSDSTGSPFPRRSSPIPCPLYIIIPVV